MNIPNPNTEFERNYATLIYTVLKLDRFRDTCLELAELLHGVRYVGAIPVFQDLSRSLDVLHFPLPEPHRVDQLSQLFIRSR